MAISGEVLVTAFEKQRKSMRQSVACLLAYFKNEFIEQSLTMEMDKYNSFIEHCHLQQGKRIE